MVLENHCLKMKPCSMSEDILIHCIMKLGWKSRCDNIKYICLSLISVYQVDGKEEVIYTLSISGMHGFGLSTSCFNCIYVFLSKKKKF